MNQMRTLAQFYVDSMLKLGLIRFSLLLAFILVLLGITVQVVVTLLFSGDIVPIDLVGSIFFGVLITPGAVYLLSIVVDQMEASRQRLANLVNKLREMRLRDLELTARLQSNIQILNQEIEERQQVEKSLAQALEELKQEINQRKEIQIELSNQTAMLQSILDASPDLVYYRNEEGEFFGCNREMELLVGMGQQQMSGLTPYDIYPPQIAEQAMVTDEKVLCLNMPHTYEQWLVYPDGHKICFELRKMPFYDRTGKRLGLIGFGRDITEYKRNRRALEKASQEKSTFISTISHELRTPLNGIVGLSRMLLDTPLTAEQTNYLNTIQISAITLGVIFNDIIDMDKFERKNLQIDRQPVRLTDFLADLNTLAGLMVQPPNLKFILESKGELPEQLMLDNTRVRQIIWNLLSNAIKFTHQGHISIQVSYKEGYLFFAVEDTGIGMPHEELEHIFTLYYQVKDQDGGRPAIGTGIGLAISKQLAQAMGGDITVNSEQGKGSCFTFFIETPLASSAEEAYEQNAPLPILHILLVEDVELNIMVAKAALEKLGNSVDVAINGKEALRLFSQDEYDLVLLDIQLPDMSGFEIARQIRQNYAGQFIPPLVALTANVLTSRAEYLNAGMDDVLSKPLSVSALISVLQRLWGKNRNNAALSGSVPVSINNQQVMDSSKSQDNVLNKEVLAQYFSLLGEKKIWQNVALFEKLMPSYLDSLNSNMLARDQQGVVDEAHKIKGAAGAIGLESLQLLAKQIQNCSSSAWWENIQEWVHILQSRYAKDVNLLKDWLTAQDKSKVLTKK